MVSVHFILEFELQITERFCWDKLKNLNYL